MPKPDGHDDVYADAVLGDYDGWLTRHGLAGLRRHPDGAATLGVMTEEGGPS